MPEFTAQDVKRLRDATGAGMMDAKRALTESGGDAEAAARWLREQGLSQMAKRTGREAAQGAVSVSSTGQAAALVEIKCETDFVAKSADFVNLASELAELVAAKGEGALTERQGDVEALGVQLKENISIGRVVRFEASDGSVLDTYLHVQSDRGVNGVLLELEGGSQQLAHDVAVHIAFGKPEYLSRDDVPPETLEQERKSFEAAARNSGKPEAALPKISEGMLAGWLKERVLLEQPYARDEKKQVQEILRGATIRRFAQVVIGA